eukprot:m51a1_g5405 putative dual specificity protein phosphatase 1-like (282) ;mRNA; f:72638-73593
MTQDACSRAQRQTADTSLISPLELFNGFRTRFRVLDVRPEAEWSRGHVRESTWLCDGSSAPPSCDELGLLSAVVVAPAGPATALPACLAKLGPRVLDGGFDAWALRYPFLCEGSAFAERKGPPLLYPTEVLPAFLYVGGIFCVKKEVFEDLGITLVINMCDAQRRPRVPWRTEHYPVVDKPGEDIAQFFDCTFNSIENERNNGGRVLVHCAAGQSRSATIVIAYIMRKEGCSYEEALERVARQRPQVKPNAGFVESLRKFEATLSAQHGASGPAAPDVPHP